MVVLPVPRKPEQSGCVAPLQQLRPFSGIKLLPYCAPPGLSTCSSTTAAGVCLRTIVTFLIMSGFGYTAREKLFYALAWTPKATVQAALSGAHAAAAAIVEICCDGRDCCLLLCRQSLNCHMA